MIKKPMLWLLAIVMTPLSAFAAELPDAIAVPGGALVATIHAEGAQIYECKRDPSGNLTWQFREPVASLFFEGQTIGRHYAGPHWELADGSVVAGKVSGRAAGASPRDIPLLRLDVTSRRGTGRLDAVTTIQRINTRGGVAEGSCPAEGEFLSAPYSADYTFYRKTN